MEQQIICKKCSTMLEPGVNFCPKCGEKVPGAELSSKERIRIYAISFFFSPFGMYWFFKYFRDPDEQKRSVAKYVLIITVVTSLIAGATIYSYRSALQNYVDVYETNMDIYSELGY